MADSAVQATATERALGWWGRSASDPPSPSLEPDSRLGDAGDAFRGTPPDTKDKWTVLTRVCPWIGRAFRYSAPRAEARGNVAHGFAKPACGGLVARGEKLAV